MTTQLLSMRLAGLAITGLLVLSAVPALAEDGSNRARIHEMNDEFDLAIERYLEDIVELEKTEGPFTMSLVEPLTGLGRSYLATGDLAQAEEALRRAQHLSHRNQGVHSPAQLPVVDVLTDKFLLENLPLEADRQQRFALFINERHYGKESPDILPALQKMADWFVQTGQYHNAREVLERMIEITQNVGGEYDLGQLEALEAIAISRQLQGVCCSYRSLETAREIIEKNASADDDTRMQVYLALADAYLVSGKAEDAHENYRKALELAGEERDTLLATPQAIAMSETLNNLRRSRTRYYHLEQDGPNRYNPYDPYGGYGHNRLRELSPEEQLLLDHQPPQEFVLTTDDRNLNIKINDNVARLEAVEPVTRVVGQPFKFNYGQLRYILPINLHSEEEIAALFVKMTFDVDAGGDVHNVEVVDTNAPLKLRRLMREVVGKARFRPAYQGLEPVDVTGVTLTQTFPLSLP